MFFKNTAVILPKEYILKNESMLKTKQTVSGLMAVWQNDPYKPKHSQHYNKHAEQDGTDVTNILSIFLQHGFAF